MIKRIMLISVLIIMLFQSTAFAVETQGEILFRDSLYGAAIGALLGGAFYLLDQDEAGKKFASGVIVGTLGVLVFGIAETTGMVEIEKDKIKFALPTPVIEKQKDGFLYSASLLKAKF